MKTIKIFLSVIIAILFIGCSLNCLAAEIGDNDVIDDFGTLYGDVNDDGEINILDLIRLKKYILNPEENRVNFAAANLSNKDSLINSMDLVLLRKLLLTGKY